MKKKLFSILLSLVMVVSMMTGMTLTASAEDMATITVDLSGGTLVSGAPAGWTDNGNGTYSKEFPKDQDVNFGEEWEGYEPISADSLFSEWVDENGWTIWYGIVYSWNFNSDQTVYAKFVPPVYLTIDLSGGNLTNGVPEGWTASADGTYSKAYPEGLSAQFGTEWEGYEPTSSDAIFNTWVDSDGYSVYGSVYMTEDTTVYAKFCPLLNVIVDLKGGAISAESVPEGWTVVTGEPDKYTKRYPAEISSSYEIKADWDNVIPTYPEASGVGFLEWEAVGGWYSLEVDNSVIQAKIGELKTVTVDFDGGNVLSADSSWTPVPASTGKYTKKYPEGYSVFNIQEEIESTFVVEEYSNGKFFKKSFTFNKYNVDGDDTLLTAEYVDGITVNVETPENGYIWYNSELKNNDFQIIIPEDSYLQPENGVLTIGNYYIDNSIVEAYGNPGYETDYYTLNGNPISSYIPTISSGDSISAVVKTGTQKYPVWVGGVQLSEGNTSVLDGTVSYDPATRVLTLDGANIISATSAAINFASDLTIDVKSDSTLSLENTNKERSCLIAGVPAYSGSVENTTYTYSTVNLNIIGDGKLTVNLKEPGGMAPAFYGIRSKKLTINTDVDIICDKMSVAQGTTVGYFRGIYASTTTINNAKVSIRLADTNCNSYSGIGACLVDGDLVINHANLSMYICKKGTASDFWNLSFVSGNLNLNSGCISADAEDPSLLAVTLSKQANIIDIKGANEGAQPTDLVFHQKDTSEPLVLLTEKSVAVSGVSMTKANYIIGETVQYSGSPAATHDGSSVTSNINSWKYTYFKQNNGKWDNIGIQAPTEKGNYKLIVETDDDEYYGRLKIPFIITTKHTVTFDANGHGTAPAPKTDVLYGSKIDAPTAPSCDGYTFGGWYREASCNSEWVFNTDVVTADATLYAKWTENIPEPTPGPTPTEEYTVPVESENTVQVEATIESGKAAVKEITKEIIEEVTKPTAGKEKSDAIVIDLSKAKQDVTAVELTSKTVENLAEAVASKDNAVEKVTIQMAEATVELDAKTLETVSKEAKGDTIRLVVDKTQQEQLKEKQKETLSNYNVNKTFEAYFESNGQRISSFNGGKVVVGIKFTPDAGKKVGNYKVYYVDDEGKMQKFASKYVDGMLKFSTTHFSDYAIVYEGTNDVLLLKAKTSGSKAIKLSWNGIDNASKYVVYGAKCGKDYKKLKTVKGKTYTVKKIAGKKLLAHKAYKFYVVGYDAVGNKIKSKTIHFITANTQGKYANVKSIKAKYDEMLLSVGVSKKIGATYKMYAGKKHIKKGHGAALRYISNNPEVVKVSKTGKTTAVGTGTATIYIQDIGGKYCKTKVTVE